MNWQPNVKLCLRCAAGCIPTLGDQGWLLGVGYLRELRDEQTTKPTLQQDAEKKDSHQSDQEQATNQPLQAEGKFDALQKLTEHATATTCQTMQVMGSRMPFKQLWLNKLPNVKLYKHRRVGALRAWVDQAANSADCSPSSYRASKKKASDCASCNSLMPLKLW